MREKAAKIAGAGQIIAVDRIKSRIELAKSMGATHGYDTTGVEDYVAGFKEVAGGIGPTVVIDSKSAVHRTHQLGGHTLQIRAS